MEFCHAADMEDLRFAVVAGEPRVIFHIARTLSAASFGVQRGGE
jgi:hypothetical protein